MRAYEITSIIVEGSQSIIDETKKAIKDILTKYSAEVTSEEDWGIKKLWYSISGHESGFYSHIKCKADAKTIEKIEREFMLNQNILKSLVIRS
ncbi:MAG TPA: 30S ribosomal protein S6 [Leptospiraceae bacterium]|nr:30S ribosomal protein S6 [Leptospiraceae bacterium]HMW07927.1 30S ribosomal protein S6 [Leptospiraceae bacterium]HMX34466.1 30S ribosomal protein S6 [Leptospiraceae bacterium]HMY34254.1 30S ribosomal protein S6 [Leptospiraceae bacterium]HMZ64706.1 30S ribosomal protein S6 [Leptospiraceae bacterium]